MRILYCDVCSTKLTDQESDQIKSGAIPLCSNCSGSHKRATPSQTKMLRKTGPQLSRRPETLIVTPRKKDSNMMMVAIAVGVVVLLSATALIINRRTDPRRTAGELPPVVTTLPATTTVSPPETHAEVSANAEKPGATGKRTDVSDPAQRQKLEEAELNQMREERAQRMLDKAKAWFKDNPEDPIAFKKMLAEVVQVTGTKACTEAEQLAKATPDTQPGLPPGTELIWLSSLDISKGRQGYRSPARDTSVDGHGISLNGKHFEKGVGTHSISEFRIQLNGGSQLFISSVGIDDESNGGSVEFIVEGDGKQLYKSKVLRAHDTPERIRVELAGIKTLILRVTDGGDGFNCDHADWADARFLVTGAHPETIAIP